jgi:branched-chain amino acid transport system ATP-binding protein
MSVSTRAFEGVAPDPGVAKPDPVLVVEGVRRDFGGLAAVDVDYLEVQRSAITALIGPNGAGKTTLFNVLTGFDRAGRGRWEFEGRSLARLPAYRVARLGMVRTFQLTRTLAKMTVIDNMKLAATGQRGEHFLAAFARPAWRAQEDEFEGRGMALLERFGLAHMRDVFAGTLSGGQRKLLEMARALMVEPGMILLDEPMAGVNPVLKTSILEHIVELKDSGLTVLFVEHDMDVVTEISDWVVCMAAGAVIAEGPPVSIVANQDVIDAYLGTRRGEG